MNTHAKFLVYLRVELDILLFFLSKLTVTGLKQSMFYVDAVIKNIHLVKS